MSGGDPLRPGYQALWDHVEAKRIDIVVTWKIDRIARSLAEMAQLEEALRARSVALHSCTEPIDTTTAQGRFVFGILATAGQLERELGSQRVRSVLSERARRGMWMHPVAPFGYCLGKGRALRKHPSEAKHVERIFADYLRLQSYAEVAVSQNHHHAWRRGRRWTQATVQRVVGNPIAVGHYRHWGQEVSRPRLRIIGDAVWERAVALRRCAPRTGKAASEAAREESIQRVFDQYIAGLDFLDSDPTFTAGTDSVNGHLVRPGTFHGLSRLEAPR